MLLSGAADNRPKAELAKKAESPVSYLNSVLAAWHDKGIRTKADATNAGSVLPDVGKKTDGHRVVTDFSADALNAAFALLNEDL